MRHTCPACGKQAFTTRAEAKHTARTLYPGQHSLTYRCGNYFHYTRDTNRSLIIARRGDITIRETDAATASHYIAQRVQATGEGPTWTELLTAMGWPRDKVWIIKTLARRGWLITGTATRSLRPGRKAVDDGGMVPVGAGQRGSQGTVGTPGTPPGPCETPAEDLRRMPADVHPGGGEPGMV